jgi:hypothetical protein
MCQSVLVMWLSKETMLRFDAKELETQILFSLYAAR